MADADWPVLQLKTRGADSKADAGVGEEWTIRLIPSLEPTALASAKLRPSRCNLRDAPDRPSACYNNRLALESSYGATLALLHSHLSVDVSGAVREAAVLLKVWQRQRATGQAGGPSGLQLTLLLLHLLHLRKATLQMGSYHILRVALKFLAETDLRAHPIVLPPPRGQAAAAAAASAEDDEDGPSSAAERAHVAAEAKAAQAARAAQAAQAFAPHFAWVLLDAEGHVNYGAGVSAGALAELRLQARRSLALLDATEMDDSRAFTLLFTTAQPPPLRYDAVLALHELPALAAQPAEAVAAEVEALLGRGLAQRTELVRAWVAPQPPSGAQAARPQTLHVGLELHPEKSAALVDRGPAAADSAAAPAWNALWGDKSQVRRFKDGAIMHAVVWESAPEAKHGIVLQAARHLLQRHQQLPPERVACGLSGLDRAMSAPACGLSHTTAGQAIHAFDRLGGALRSLQGLPLSILAIRPAAAIFSHCEEFPPAPSALGAPPPPGSPPLRFVIQFESSGRWPADLGAVQALKGAFYLKLAALLEEQAQLHTEARRDALFVQCDGFTFVGAILHAGEAQLLSAAGRPLDALALRETTRLRARHTAAMSAVANAHPCFGATVRLCKRWVNAQLLSGSVPAELIELLVAHTYTSPAGRPAGTALNGLLQFLQLVQRHDFAAEPLLLPLDSPLTTEAKAAALAAFERARAAPGGGPAVYVATDAEPAPEAGDANGDAAEVAPDGAASSVLRCSAWSQQQPTPLLLRRLRALAANAARCLHAAMMDTGPVDSAAATTKKAKGAPPAADPAAVDARLAATMLPAFLPPLHEFDALLELEHRRSSLPSWPHADGSPHPSLARAPLGPHVAHAHAHAMRMSSIFSRRPRRLPLRHLQLKPPDASTQDKPAAARPFANLQHGRIAQGVDREEEVAAYVRALEARHGGLALFFYDRNGGAAVALKWRPRAFLPAAWKPADAQGRLLLSRAAAPERKDAGALGASSWLLPNVPELLEDMRAMSDGLVRRARLVQSPPVPWGH